MQSTTDILLLGAGGKVAQFLVRLFLSETDWTMTLMSGQETAHLYPTTSRLEHVRCAAMDHKEVRKECLSRKPRVVINCAAMTDVDACESDKQLASALNVKVVENLVRACSIGEAHLIHFSTDYVFNGEKGPYTETDVPDPVNYYGRTKLAGENAILTSKIPSTIIRTNIVYGHLPGVKKDFVTWVRDSGASGSGIAVVDDQFGNPTAAADLAVATMRVIEKGRTGIYHVAGPEYLDRYSFARRIAAYFGADPSFIRPQSTAQLRQPARRPLRAGLVTLKAQTDLGLRLTCIDDGLLEYKRSAPARPSAFGDVSTSSRKAS
ncbi:MAG: SDR family oxidoreductase [Candidatus Kapaibacterium sp.]